MKTLETVKMFYLLRCSMIYDASFTQMTMKA